MGKRAWFPVVSGPLAPYATGFEVWLRARSYSSSATANRLCRAGSAQPVARSPRADRRRAERCAGGGVHEFAP